MATAAGSEFNAICPGCTEPYLGGLRWVCDRRLWVATMLLMLSYLWGSCWGLQAAYQSLGHQLPEALDRQEFVVTGTIVGLVDSNNQRSRFDFRVDSINGELGSQLWNTAEQGALSFVWSESGELAIEAARPDGPQFWWRAASVDSTGIMLEFDPVAED